MEALLGGIAMALPLLAAIGVGVMTFMILSRMTARFVAPVFRQTTYA
jgi:hypothetical protein